jgi:hypothetical protein
MHIKKDDIPLVAAPLDDLWIKFDTQSLGAVIWVSSVSSGATFEISSGVTAEPGLLTVPVVTTLGQKGLVALTTLPLGAGDVSHRYVRVRPTAGQISVSVAGPLGFSHHMKVLIT